MKILYNVTVKVDNEIHDDWYQWMRTTHVPEVMATGIFLSYKMLKIIGDDDDYGKTYAIQYECENMEIFQTYQLTFAPKLQSDTRSKFGDKCPAFRTLMEIHD